MSTLQRKPTFTGRHLIMFRDDTSRADISALNLTTPAENIEDNFDDLSCLTGIYASSFLHYRKLTVVETQVDLTPKISRFSVDLIRSNSSTKNSYSLSV